MTEIATNIEVKSSEETSNIIIRYGWGNELLKTWFLTRSKKTIVPKSSRLLMIFSCKETDEPISSFNTSYPEIDDVVSDVDGEHIKIKTINWV